MLFNSLDFLMFFPAVFIVFTIIPPKLRKVWLLICSYFFYMCWDYRCIVLIVFSTLVTYLSGIFIKKYEEEKLRKAIVAVSFTLNLGILFVFKYLNFLIGSASAITGREFVPYNIILPVGISFYTFQALGYTIDCYRGTIEPERSLIKYALFVSFFPQLVAGPIERSRNLLSQIDNLSVMTRRDIFEIRRLQEGFILIVWGMFLKLVIADRVAIIVDNVYSNVNLYGSVGLFIAFLGFGIQIYCDFNSYSTVAIGAARFFNINLMENFNAPYFATSITDFWRKWHISLSSWFRDYLYIPLGGSRKGYLRKLLNILVVFACSGLWHGANWTFVFWGMFHGTLLVIENILRPFVHRIDDLLEINKKSFGFKVCRAAVVTMVVDVAWVFFRAESFGQAYIFLKRLVTKGDLWKIFDGSIYQYGLDINEVWILVIGLAVLFTVDLIRVKKNLTIGEYLLGEYAVFRVVVVLFLMMFTIVFGQYGPGFDSKEFIYFQF